MARSSHANDLTELASPSDLSAIKRLADRHRQEIGFVLSPAIQASIEAGELLVVWDRNAGNLLGFVRFHLRRDATTKVYEICVDPEARRRGVGRLLIAGVEERAQLAGHRRIALKCPCDLPANTFYERLRFVDGGLEAGKKRSLRLWSRELRS